MGVAGSSLPSFDQATAFSEISTQMSGPLPALCSADLPLAGGGVSILRRVVRAQRNQGHQVIDEAAGSGGAGHRAYEGRAQDGPQLHLAHRMGDAINAILAAVGFNFCLLWRFIAQFFHLIQICLFGPAQHPQAMPAIPQG